MENTDKIREVQGKLYEQLKPSGWGDKLKMFILSQEFYSILEKLYSDNSMNIRFTPVLKDVFRAFLECPYDKTNVVFVGQDPYPQAGVADGILFSCSHTGKMQPSLRFVLEEVKKTGAGEIGDVDLTRWSNQGVLMLNTALTCEVQKIGSHIDLWEPFMRFLFDVLGKKQGLIYVFLGQKARNWNKFIQKGNSRFFTTHPASSAYNSEKRWVSGDLFNNVNNLLAEKGKKPINW